MKKTRCRSSAASCPRPASATTNSARNGTTVTVPVEEAVERLVRGGLRRRPGRGRRRRADVEAARSGAQGQTCRWASCGTASHARVPNALGRAGGPMRGLTPVWRRCAKITGRRTARGVLRDRRPDCGALRTRAPVRLPMARRRRGPTVDGWPPTATSATRCTSCWSPCAARCGSPRSSSTASGACSARSPGGWWRRSTRCSTCWRSPRACSSARPRRCRPPAPRSWRPPS